ncbi:MAG: DnaJ domain-containing protein [Myxococcota bacterium]|nr:DnaJ domain-containing protein [Myxococcota bacterium]
MTDRNPQFDAYVLKIHHVLDRLDYYRLLGVDVNADLTSIKSAFHTIAAKFHPDRNRSASPDIKRALYDIFKRLNEAYRVLTDPDRRAFYNKGLESGKTRLEQDLRKTAIPKTPEDTIRSPQARQFYRQAAEELKKGNILKADLHLKVAMRHEPSSGAIKALIDQIQQAKSGQKK